MARDQRMIRADLGYNQRIRLEPMIFKVFLWAISIEIMTPVSSVWMGDHSPMKLAKLSRWSIVEFVKMS